MLQAIETEDEIKSETPIVKIGNLSDFSGGMLTTLDPLKLEDNQYYFLKNGRVRYGDIESINKPQDITSSIRTGHLQGLYAMGSSLILFSDGVAYFRDFGISQQFFERIHGFEAMNASAAKIYAELVPTSYNNLERRSVSGNATDDVILGNNQFGSPASLVCQDGSHQPRLIFPNKLSKIANDISRWTKDNREYVPVGKQMLYKDGVLYVVSPDGTLIYRSLIGRPLDFVIAIDNDGNRLPKITEEEAARLPHTVTFEAITSLGNLNSPPTEANLSGAFLVTTEKFSWMVIPNTSKVVYSEPTFINVDLFPTGTLNQFSIVNILGDTVFVDYSGIKSFNAISQFTNDGSNSSFSKDVHSLFRDKIQANPASVVFDNYALFGVNTIYGEAILVYDELYQKFVSIDIFDNVIGTITQFAEIKVNGARRLFFITDANRLYEAYASTEVAECEVYTKEWASGDTMVEQHPQRINLSFADVVSPGGNVTVEEFVDRKSGGAKVKNIASDYIPPASNIIDTPFGDSTEENTKNVTFKLDHALKGYRAGLKIRFNFKGKLSLVEFRSKLITNKVSKREKLELFNAAR